MRRTIMAAVATLSLAAPSAALAHHGERHHHHHRGRHHHVHVLAFHAQAPASTPSTTPTGSDSAGTIASFNEGVLTIKLNDGSTVSGKVDEGTWIECPATTASAADFGRDGGDDDDRFDDNGRDGEDHHGDCPGHDDNGGVANHQHCTIAALVPGASVEEAFLAVGSQGARWVKVEL